MEKKEAFPIVKENRKKISFKMPHLLWIMTGLLVFSSILTYIIPAGKFAVDEAGAVIGTQFSYLSAQSPVNLGQMLMLMMDGILKAAPIIFIVMATGATITILLDSGSVDNILNWAIYKLKDKGMNLLIIALFVLIVYIGGFAGSDALIALVPVGVIFARKLKLDPIVAVGITTFPAMIGFGTGPQTQFLAQMMMGVQPYSGFGLRFLFMNIFMVIGLLYLMRYVKKIQKDPTNSAMYSEGWRPDNYEDENSEGVLKEERLKLSSILAFVAFLGQYFFIISYSMQGGEYLFKFMIATHIVTGMIIGLINRMSFDDIGTSFAKGINSMGFVGLIIGLAGVFSLVLTQGNILDTIVYILTRPLMNISQGLSNVGIALVVGILNPLVPSATSKAAILIPIIRPISEALGVTGQTAVQAFQFGDGFTNMISPVLGWTVGSLIMAKVPYNKWFKWVLPAIIMFMSLASILLFILTSIGWTGV